MKGSLPGKPLCFDVIKDTALFYTDRRGVLLGKRGVELHRPMMRRLLALLHKVCDSRVGSTITILFFFPAPLLSDVT